MLNEIEVGLICLSERKKFKEVYEEYFTALKYFAMRYVKDEEVACDLLQDIFVKLWEKGDRFENEMQLKTYLYRVVRNHCLTYVRDTQRKEKRMEGFEVEETEERYEKANAIYRIYIENIHLFDKLILNTQNGYDSLRCILMQLVESMCEKQSMFVDER